MNETLYYIQNTGFSGNCLKWWAIDGKGYTLNLDAAWKVPKANAEAICRDRPQQDIMWPVDEIDAVASRHLNIEALTMEQKAKAAGR
jgi:hypothetical protein